MTEPVKILRINDLVTNLDNKQIGIEPSVDPDLAYKMWGGKDADGNVTKWLAKDKPLQVTTATLTDPSTSGGDGLIRHDSTGLLSGGAITLAELNLLISDANLVDIGDVYLKTDILGLEKVAFVADLTELNTAVGDSDVRVIFVTEEIEIDTVGTETLTAVGNKDIYGKEIFISDVTFLDLTGNAVYRFFNVVRLEGTPT